MFVFVLLSITSVHSIYIKHVVKRMLTQHILASRFETLPNLLHTSLPMVMFCPASTKYNKLHAIHKRESTPTGSASSRNFRFRLCSCKRLFSSCSVSPSVNNKPIIWIKQNGVCSIVFRCLINMCGPRGGQGVWTPPLENHKNIGVFSAILVRIPLKS